MRNLPPFLASCVACLLALVPHAGRADVSGWLRAGVPVPRFTAWTATCGSLFGGAGAEWLAAAQGEGTLDALFEELLGDFSPEVRDVILRLYRRDPHASHPPLVGPGQVELVVTFDPALETERALLGRWVYGWRRSTRAINRLRVLLHPQLRRSRLLYRVTLMHELVHVGQALERMFGKGGGVGPRVFLDECLRGEFEPFTELSAGLTSYLAARSVGREPLLAEIERFIDDSTMRRHVTIYYSDTVYWELPRFLAEGLRERGLSVPAADVDAFLLRAWAGAPRGESD